MNAKNSKMTEKHVVTCFLEHKGKILILRRSEKVDTYKGRWAGVSGYVEKSVDEQALIEIEEETKLTEDDVELVRKEKFLEGVDEELVIRWIVHPFLFRVKDSNKIKIDWEHKEIKWILLKDIGRYKTVPKLKETLESVM